MSEQRMVDCIKLGKSLPGLRRPPYRDELGKRIYSNVSEEAWKMWLEQQKMILNEYRLNPTNPDHMKTIKEQTEQHFFGGGVSSPEGFVDGDAGTAKPGQF